VRLTNRLRNLAAGALATHLLVSDNVTERPRRRKPCSAKRRRMAGLLQQRLTAETDGAVKSQLEIALARLQLVSPQPARGWRPSRCSATPVTRKPRRC
jgi:urea transport system permease protein